MNRNRSGPHFVCPECGGQDWKVIDSEFSTRRNAYRRRRECLGYDVNDRKCHHRFTTWESDEPPASADRSTWNRHRLGV